ncbi:MAG: hypothetical protein DRO08_04130 [Thermoprotei archaeon]|nr:MAG: hypothetical protein DRO08_04130 [Thermoprotei archaeon]
MEVLLLIGIIVWIMLSTYLIGYEENSERVTILTVYIITTILIGCIYLEYVDAKVREHQYIHFRDSKYPNYSENKDYKHWLLDNPNKDKHEKHIN